MSRVSLLHVAAVLMSWAVVAVPSGAHASMPVNLSVSDQGFGFHRVGVRSRSMRLTIRNGGTHRHDFNLDGTVHGERLHIGTAGIAPGASVTLSLRLPAGDYSIYSSVGHDRRNGIDAELRVMNPGASGPARAETDRLFFDY